MEREEERRTSRVGGHGPLLERGIGITVARQYHAVSLGRCQRSFHLLHNLCHQVLLKDSILASRPGILPAVPGVEDDHRQTALARLQRQAQAYWVLWVKWQSSHPATGERQWRAPSAPRRAAAGLAASPERWSTLFRQPKSADKNSAHSRWA